MNHNHNHMPKKGTKDEMAICPVTNTPVNKNEAKKAGLVRKYKGKTYYLCCAGCEAPFDKDPEAYINKHSSSDVHHGHSHMEHDHGSKIKYICPMHPEIVKDERGSCPICHMALEKKEINLSLIHI